MMEPEILNLAKVISLSLQFKKTIVPQKIPVARMVITLTGSMVWKPLLFCRYGEYGQYGRPVTAARV
jgi:hypothetical protein